MFNNLLKKQKQDLECQLEEIEKTIQIKTNRINELNSQIAQADGFLRQINQNIVNSKRQIEEYKLELGIAEGIITMQELGMEYTPNCNDLNELAVKKVNIQKSIASLIGNNKAIITTRVYRIDGSESKGKKFQKVFCENLLIGFNSYFNKKKKSITAYNYNSSVEFIKSKFDKMNQKASLMGVSINSTYLDLVLNLLQLELDEKIVKTEEKERIKEERRRLREQEKLLAEAEKAKLELQKQRRMYEQSLAKALNEQERQEFEAKLKEIDKREADVDYRINNSKAGYLYITATKAMPNMTKLGVTRRLNPLVRIQELSTASTPWPFVCYGLVFSDDAFDLETRIHEYFDNKRVNKENKHKEFFYITPQEAIKVLKEEFGCDVHFVNEEESGDEE
nr:MAG TPA: helicase [Caudoviricetes sp.]